MQADSESTHASEVLWISEVTVHVGAVTRKGLSKLRSSQPGKGLRGCYSEHSWKSPEVPGVNTFWPGNRGTPALYH